MVVISYSWYSPKMHSEFTAVDKDSVQIVVYPPRQCACGRMAAFLVNRLGQTRCVECDHKAQERKGRDGNR